MGYRKSRNPEGIETVHLRDRCRKSGTSRHIANRDIGDPGYKGFVHFEIAETPMSCLTVVTANGHVNQDSARRAQVHRESGNRESGNRESCGHKHYVIANPETPTRGLVAVT